MDIINWAFQPNFYALWMNSRIAERLSVTSLLPTPLLLARLAVIVAIHLDAGAVLQEVPSLFAGLHL